LLLSILVKIYTSMHMKKIWQSISYLGTQKYTNSIDIRKIVLCNRINMLIIISMTFTFIVLRIHGYITNQPPGIASLKIVLIAINSIFCIVLVRYYYSNLSKLATAILPSFLFLYFPLFFNYIEEDSFITYPNFAIAASLVPLLIFSYSSEKVVYYISLVYCTLSVLLADYILLLLSPDSIEIKSIINENYLFFKMSSFITYLFINLIIFYLINLNRKAESNLEQNNMELIAALDNLNIAQKQLIQSEKMASVGILSAGVAHEINNPINFIYSGIQSLEENYNDLIHYNKEVTSLVQSELSEKTRMSIYQLNEKYDIEDCKTIIPQLIENIKTGSERTEAIVKSLRYFASFNDEALSYINLNDTIDITLEILKSRIAGSISIIKNYSTDIKLIKCFPVLFKQLIYNILTNAVDELDKGGVIVISTAVGFNERDIHSNDEYIKIGIKDSGKGIDNEDLDKIFLPFYTTKDVGKATGMGLAVCHNIIEKHNGRIFVNSKKGEGSEFFILIPTNL